MAKVTFITESGDRVEVQASPGQTLMQAAVDADVEGIMAECGGACACATCHIIFEDQGFQIVGEANELEKGMLAFADGAGERSRLACQIDVNEKLDGLSVTVGA